MGRQLGWFAELLLQITDERTYIIDTKDKKPMNILATAKYHGYQAMTLGGKWYFRKFRGN